jgi:hypothetical protein
MYRSMFVDAHFFCETQNEKKKRNKQKEMSTTLWNRLFGKHADRLLNEELMATWFATAVLMSVLGSQFSSRDMVSLSDRQTVDFLFLSVSCIMLLWAMSAYYNLVPLVVHRVVFLCILLITLAEFFYIMFLVSQGRL